MRKNYKYGLLTILLSLFSGNTFSQSDPDVWACEVDYALNLVEDNGTRTPEELNESNFILSVVPQAIPANYGFHAVEGLSSLTALGNDMELMCFTENGVDSDDPNFITCLVPFSATLHVSLNTETNKAVVFKGFGALSGSQRPDPISVSTFQCFNL